jgi:hypothetical protein
LNIEQYERMRFLVESESGESPYLVDLLEYTRWGECDCRNFRIEIKPIWDDGGIPRVKMCKHILRCRRRVASQIVNRCNSRRFTHRQLDRAVSKVLMGLWKMEMDAKQNPMRIACTSPITVYPGPFVSIAPKSPRRLREDEEYFSLVAQFKLDRPFCEVCAIRGKTPRPTKDPHHRRGRAGNLRMAIETWTAVCRECHNYIESNKAWAKEHGLIENWGVQV